MKNDLEIGDLIKFDRYVYLSDFLNIKGNYEKIISIRDYLNDLRSNGIDKISGVYLGFGFDCYGICFYKIFVFEVNNIIHIDKDFVFRKADK